MKVKRSSWCSKISNFGVYRRVNDNLCKFFWRIVGKVLLVLAVIFYVALIGYYWAIPILIVVIFIMSAILVPYFAIYYLREFLGKSPEMPFGEVTVEYLKAKKHKYCPTIEYID